MASPRPHIAVAAAAVLAALYFVPSAHGATGYAAGGTAGQRSASASDTRQAAASGSLAETGMMDTKPYLIGGGVLVLAGAGLVVNATRRSRLQAAAEADEADPEE